MTDREHTELPFLPSIDVCQTFDLLTPEGGGIGFG